MGEQEVTSLLEVKVSQFPGILDAATGSGIVVKSEVTTKSMPAKFNDVISGSKFRECRCVEVAAVDVTSAVSDTSCAFKIDELSLVECNELVTVVGQVRERWIEADKFSKNETNGSDGGILKGSVLHIKFSSSATSKDTVSFYYSTKHTTFPLGALPGAKVCALNVTKKVSNQGRPYLKSTAFTEIKVIEPPDLDQLTSSLIHVLEVASGPTLKLPTFKVMMT